MGVVGVGNSDVVEGDVVFGVVDVEEVVGEVEGVGVWVGCGFCGVLLLSK